MRGYGLGLVGMASLVAGLLVACGGGNGYSGPTSAPATARPAVPTAETAAPTTTVPSAEAVAPTPTIAADEAHPVGWHIGERAPDFELATLSGSSVSLGQLRAAGKPFILYFFATW